MKTVILANGQYPVHKNPLGRLAEADMIVCCDGAAEKLVAHGLEPDAIVGDLDSVSPALRQRYSVMLFHDPDQETNDLTKAVRWCISQGIREVTIVGATGLREDHTVANISLMAEYCADIKTEMLTDNGIFEACTAACSFRSYPGQQISLFSVDPATEVTSRGLRYPLKKLRLTNWWRGTLNEATGESFSLDFTGGRIILFRKY